MKWDPYGKNRAKNTQTPAGRIGLWFWSGLRLSACVRSFKQQSQKGEM